MFRLLDAFDEKIEAQLSTANTAYENSRNALEDLKEKRFFLVTQQRQARSQMLEKMTYLKQR